MADEETTAPTSPGVPSDIQPDIAASIPPRPKQPGMYIPIYIMTAVFAAIFIIVPFFFRKFTNSGIIRCSIMVAAFSMWLFWVTVYVAQMNPLMGPRFKNSTLAWIGHAWGKNAKLIPSFGNETPLVATDPTEATPTGEE